jgi:transposase-like protein
MIRMHEEKKAVKCPSCGGRNIVKRGKQTSKRGKKQTYYCKDCEKRFVETGIGFKGRRYDAGVILDAISYYNLGNTLIESSRLLKKKHKIDVRRTVIHDWVNEFKDLCSYNRVRDKINKKYGKDLIVSKVYRHKGLTYNFKYHRGKLEEFGKRWGGLIDYLMEIERGCPTKYFEEDDRCSQLKLRVNVRQRGTENYACKLAKFALAGVRDNRERHDAVERFMLINDSCTVACEVPVWYWDKKLNIGVCGHIDILQFRFGNIWILDYKPGAAREKKAKTQLYLYALALSFRTRIPLREFRCAWFDDNVYYEFNPVEVKIER